MRNFRMTIHIKSPLGEVFNAITNPLTIELWSGYPALFEPVVNSEFSIFDGDITGKILAVDVPNMIEQEWYFGDQEEASIVRYDLAEDSGKTKIELQHSNIPDEAYDDIATGWKRYYLGALKSYLEN